MSLHKIFLATALLSACAVSPDDASDPSASEQPADDVIVSATTQSVLAVPAFRSKTTTQNGLSISKPSGVVAGDFMLAALEYDAHPVVITPPAGWTKIADQISGSGTSQVFHALVFKHVATSSEPSSYMFMAPDGVYVDITMLAYTGVTAVDGVSGAGAITGTIVAPNMNTSQNNELLVSVFIDFVFGNWSTSAGMAVRANFDANSVQDVLIPVAGPTDKHLASNSFGAQAAVNITLK